MRSAVAPLAGTGEGARELAVGAGGDRTLELDRRAEATTVEVLERLAARHAFCLLSEELGRRSFGADLPLLLLDPVDGSLNAKRGVQLFAFMAALATGPTVADVVAGYVLNLVTGETWHAVRGGGAHLDGRRFSAPRRPDGEGLELLGIEGAPGALVRAAPLLAMAGRVRIPGSMALAINYAAAGRFDAFCAPAPARVFDMTAGLLIAEEAGATATDLTGRSLGDLPADLSTRSDLLVAAGPAQHRRALAAIGAG